MKIELPNVRSNPSAKAHPFPVQVAQQTQEFMQGAIFFQMLSDTASGQRFRQPNALNEVQSSLEAGGMDRALWEQGWGLLEKYQELFAKSVRQNALISLRSHWDWYVGHLGRFVLQSYEPVFRSVLSKTKSRNLEKLGFKEISQQIEILRDTAKIEVSLNEEQLGLVREMSLVRNLGLHNRWEVDSNYLEQTNITGLELGEIRLFEIKELEQWHSALVDLVNQTWKPVAIQFVDAPPYEYRKA